MTRRALVCVALLATACTGGTKVAGAGEATSLCGAVREYNALPAPDTTVRQQVLDHVAAVLRILDRVDGGITEDHHPKPPAAVLDQVKQEKASYQRLRSSVEAATTPAALHSVVSSFATDDAFAANDTGVELWASNSCA